MGMIDREKVIKGLHCCAHTDGINCIHCPYDIKGEDCTAKMSMDVLTMLKEQEPAMPTWRQGKAYCGKCGQRLLRKTADRKINYCGYCGQAVKWE
jgi:hypothetical protein